MYKAPTRKEPTSKEPTSKAPTRKEPTRKALTRKEPIKKTQKKTQKHRNTVKAVAVFNTSEVQGEVLIFNSAKGVTIKANFTKLPKGKHGFHIHKAGDLRGEGCKGLCEHYDIGNHLHGSVRSKERHTGDLGNVEMKHAKHSYTIKSSVQDLLGRSFVIHADEDDLGKGHFSDSKITGHSGARIACAIIGRAMC